LKKISQQLRYQRRKEGTGKGKEKEERKREIYSYFDNAPQVNFRE
jgi:hypothetical protein